MQRHQHLPAVVKVTSQPTASIACIHPAMTMKENRRSKSILATMKRPVVDYDGSNNLAMALVSSRMNSPKRSASRGQRDGIDIILRGEEASSCCRCSPSLSSLRTRRVHYDTRRRKNGSNFNFYSNSSIIVIIFNLTTTICLLILMQHSTSTSSTITNCLAFNAKTNFLLPPTSVSTIIRRRALSSNLHLTRFPVQRQQYPKRKITRQSSRPVSFRLSSSSSSSSSSELHKSTQQQQQQQPLQILVCDRNIETNTTQPLVYSINEDRYIRQDSSPGRGMNKYTARQLTTETRNKLLRVIQHAFVPLGVNPSYYQFMKWRILQRFVNSNLHVLGTQSLLMGLGLKSKSLGVSAALTWVLKDALGKLTRLVWASRMGRRFDSDAKRWRFRASLVYALGNYLEIVTYINPTLFLLWATLANSCKQVAMLTSSATRSALYNSFRDGKRENIADITAKGEAQIAVVDLLGIAFGVSLSRAVGTSVKSVVSTYIILQILELNLLFREIRSVQFNVMNFERMAQVIEAFLDVDCQDSQNNALNGATATIRQEGPKTGLVPRPEHIAKKERIFLPPKHLRRRALAFGSMGRAKLNPDELSRLVNIFSKDRYMLIVGENTKKDHRKLGLFQTTTPEEAVQQNCHIVLHEEATNLDILKSTLAVFLLRKKLVASGRGVVHADNGGEGVADLRCSDVYDLLEETRDETDRLFPLLIKQLSQQGWAPPSRNMFGRVQQRAYWPLNKQ